MSEGALTELPESSPEVDGKRRFGDLRSVQWRIDLGVLPSSQSASPDELRRVTADSRRRYASLRRRLLIDPHISKDGSNSPDLSMDNPLSQNPESSWGRFFRNAELEQMVDQDLLRLYPEDGSFFQTPGCQGMLRRILLLWCLTHPQYGYGQGMHELLAPLIYVLQVDINRLSQVRELYEDHFTDKFDELSVHESDFTYNFDYRRFSKAMEDPTNSHGGNIAQARSLDDLDPDIHQIVLLSDPYGAEGELGILLSEKFMEHDAYSMFEALMSGVDGSVAMAEFFSHLPADGTSNSSPPVIEASAALYHLLSVVDLSLHTHLTELGVEPQYFCLRWLRVLFRREFALLDLLVIWDEFFAQDNRKIDSEGADGFAIFGSARGAFIAAMAVSMILYMRSSLLGAELATSALQRLLNFPHNVELKKLIQKAKTLQTLVLNSRSTFLMGHSVIGAFDQRKQIVRCHSPSSDSVSPKSPLSLVPDSYWEERWRILHNEEEKIERSSSKKQASTPINRKGWTEKAGFSLARTESDPLPAMSKNVRKVPTTSVRRSLLKDLSRQLGSDEGIEDIVPEDEVGSSENSGSEEDSSTSSDSLSTLCKTIDNEKSISQPEEHRDSLQSTSGDSPLPVSYDPGASSLKSLNEDSLDSKDVKEQKPMFEKFQWFWKFGRGHTSEETVDKGENSSNTPNLIDPEESHNIETKSLKVDENHEPSFSSIPEGPDLKVMGTFKNLGQAMLEQVQVIESVFQQDRCQVGPLESFSKNILVGKGQVTAMAALKELRKISNLLSEM